MSIVPAPQGLSFQRKFTSIDIPVESMFNWTRRHVSIKGDDGAVVYSADVEAPDFWSDLAVTVAAKTWFRRINGEMETSIMGMITRVVDAIAEASRHPDVGCDYFGGDETKRRAFRDELFYICAGQYALFNTPVWVNVGVATPKHAGGVGPQASACFIQAVADSMDSLCALQTSETHLFRRGSGTGSNLSMLRPKDTALSGGGTASGPVSFMRGLDGWAGVTKSGGSSRRAALMRILDVYHPDIFSFIETKTTAQKMIRDLGAQGWSTNFNATATTWIPYQNANQSVRVDDAFMLAATSEAGQINLHWPTYWHGSEQQISGQPVIASKLLDSIAQAAWDCGDPGMQFDTTINAWHTSPVSARINASNPCCLTGDMLVDTTEGPLSFNQLMQWQREGKDLPYAFSFDCTARLPVLRRIKRVWQSGQARELVEVKTDKGVTVRCTPEHRFLLQDGTYCEAQHLSLGMRLRKIARQANPQRSGRRMINHRILPGCLNGSEYQNRFIWEQVVGPIPKGYEVHHLNGDPTDDRLSNLSLMLEKDHLKEHSAGENNPRFIEMDMRLAVEAWEYLEAAPRRTHKAFTGVSLGRWNAYIHKNGLVGVLPLANKRGIQGLTWEAFTQKINAHRSLVNDRVASVRRLVADEPVFDLEVEGTHNFGVRTPGQLHSIVVHNSEYMYVDNSACNLASQRLTKYLQADGTFDIETFEHVCRTVFVAQEVLVGAASYPTELIAKNSHDFRPLGLGYADLGALLMQLGLAYDSDEGRAYAGAVTALMGGVAYLTSAEIARDCGGPFPRFAENRDAMLRVMQKHVEAARALQTSAHSEIAGRAYNAWLLASTYGGQYGFRNGQGTVLAPTGTIGFAMDCDTTGVEPDTALVKVKNLAGGGRLEYVNRSIEPALRRLGYDETKINRIINLLHKTGELPVAYEGHPSDGDRWLKERHLPIFATAFGQPGNEVSIDGHLKMMAAVQPFLSGAISKTVNCPSHYTVADIREVFVKAWKLGLKAVAVYRDGCKDQPLEAKKVPEAPPTAQPNVSSPSAAKRRRLPSDRRAHCHKFTLGGVDGYVHLGFYENGDIGEIFVRMEPKASALVVDIATQAASIAIQHGADLSTFLDKWEGTAFAPSGFTGEGAAGVPYASSPLDYLAKWLRRWGLNKMTEIAQETGQYDMTPPMLTASRETCPRCSSMMRRDGACLSCPTCGHGQGGCGG